MKTILKNKQQTFLFAALVSLIFAGCQCEIQQPAATYVAPVHASHHTISAEAYGKVIIKPTDTLTVNFPCTPKLPSLPAGIQGSLSGNSVTLWAVSDVADGSPSMRLGGLGSPAGFSHTIQFQTPTYMLGMSSGETFSPGDVNTDGKKDMMDLYPIVRALWEHGDPSHIDWELPYPANLPYSGTLNTSSTYLRQNSGETWAWDTRNIDYMHADCNYDGVVNLNDVELLKSVLEPLKTPDFLLGTYSGIKLSAQPNGTVEIWTPAVTPFNLDPNPQVRAWYDITVENMNDTTKILGVVFTRAVDEYEASAPLLPRYTVLDIQAKTDGSDLFDHDSNMVFLQRYWHDITIELPDSCIFDPDLKTKPLDVGVFNKIRPQPMDSGSKVINCCVTIDDIMRTISNGGPIYQHLVDVVVFYEDDAGNVTATTTDCAFDGFRVDTRQIIKYDTPPADWPNGGN